MNTYTDIGITLIFILQDEARHHELCRGVVVVAFAPRIEIAIDPRGSVSHISSDRRVSDAAIATIASRPGSLQSPRGDTNLLVVADSSPRSTAVARASSGDILLSGTTATNTDHGGIDVCPSSQRSRHDILAQLVLQHIQGRRL